jgi:hypothetical protein
MCEPAVRRCYSVFPSPLVYVTIVAASKTRNVRHIVDEKALARRCTSARTKSEQHRTSKASGMAGSVSAAHIRLSGMTLGRRQAPVDGALRGRRCRRPDLHGWRVRHPTEIGSWSPAATHDDDTMTENDSVYTSAPTKPMAGEIRCHDRIPISSCRSPSYCRPC